MFDAPSPDKPRKAPRPRDAATLILIRRDGPVPRVMMGQRSDAHSFMPNKFVFPGGRVDAADARLVTPNDLLPEVAAKAAHGATPNRARAFALAAVRETFEETGLRLATENGSGLRSRSRAWTDFSEARYVPALDQMSFVFRAITPPYRHKRYDTRFFIAEAEALADLEPTPLSASGELLKLHWVPLPDTFDLDLPNVTKLVLQKLKEIVEAPDLASVAPSFMRFEYGKPVLDEI